MTLSRNIEGEADALLPALTVLGIETSCDETAAAVISLPTGGRAVVRSSVVFSQIAEHAPFGGVVPEIAARSHVESIDIVVARALAEAGARPADLDGVAATAGPGLVGGVMVGLSFGKAMALALGKPLIAVNHLEGHAVSARLTADIPYPFLLLLVSGGHCQLLEVAGVGACRRLGSTIDDAAGEAFDKIGGALGLPYPAGPALEALAVGGDAARFPLPRALLGREGYDFSFSGLKTAAARLAYGLTALEDRRDLAAAVQTAIARQLAERTGRAMALYAREHDGRDRRFVVAGGVAANGEVRRTLEALAAEHGFAFHAPPLAYCTDNAAMIALAGAERLALGLTDALDAPARPRWPLDEAAARLHPTHLAGRKGAKA
jgi:N6-L-threonylcarbamoyladenine synthase